MQPQEMEILEKHTQALIALTEALSKRSVNVPHDKELWNADECSIYLRMAKKTFQSYYAPHPRFPERIELDRSGGKSNPLWRASEVIEWAINRK